MKIIFHLDDAKNLDLNIKLINNALTENNEIYFLINREAVKLINDEKLSKLEDIEIAVCENSLKTHQILPSNKKIKVIKNAFQKIIEKQNQGYAYIKP